MQPAPTFVHHRLESQLCDRSPTRSNRPVRAYTHTYAHGRSRLPAGSSGKGFAIAHLPLPNKGRSSYASCEANSARLLTRASAAAARFEGGLPHGQDAPRVATANGSDRRFALGFKASGLLNPRPALAGTPPSRNSPVRSRRRARRRPDRRDLPGSQAPRNPRRPSFSHGPRRRRRFGPRFASASLSPLQRNRVSSGERSKRSWRPSTYWTGALASSSASRSSSS